MKFPPPALELPQSFWDELTEKYWRKKPTVFKGVMTEPLVTPAEYFQGLAAMVRRVEAEPEKGLGFRFLSNGKPLTDSSCMPTDEDRSGPEWIERVQRKTGPAEIALIANNVHGCNEPLWFRCNHFTSALGSRVALPLGSVLGDAFLGNYRTTPFGVHKDEQEVFWFVVEGRKTFHLWPFEMLAAPNDVPDDDARRVSNSRFNLPDVEAAPIVLEAGPGDIVYWPAEYWHIAVSDGQYASGISLGLCWDSGIDHLHSLSRQMVVGTREEYSHHLRSRSPEASARSVEEALSAMLSASRFKATLRRENLRWLSGNGFQVPPQPDPDIDDAPDDMVVQVSRLHPVYLDVGESMTLMGQGRALDLPFFPQVAALVERLNNGEPISVGALLAATAGTITSGDNTYEADPEQLRRIVVWLLSHRAIFVRT